MGILRYNMVVSYRKSPGKQDIHNLNNLWIICCVRLMFIFLQKYKYKWLNKVGVLWCFIQNNNYSWMWNVWTSEPVFVQFIIRFSISLFTPHKLRLKTCDYRLGSEKRHDIWRWYIISFLLIYEHPIFLDKMCVCSWVILRTDIILPSFKYIYAHP